MNSESFETHLEKLCIVNHLFRRDTELYLKYGHSQSLMDQLWGGKFSDEENVEEKYWEANEVYRGKLWKLMRGDVSRVKDMHPTGRLFIETFEEK